jgi:hypothetical protein
MGSAAVAAAALVWAGCASATGPAIVEPVALQTARVDIPEDQLLDVGVEIFEDGLDEDADPRELQEQGISPEVRRAEARFIPVHLKQTLESTGHWGAVRVLPAGTGEADLRVAGRILKSNGKDLEIEVRATDARGEEWLERRYAETADTRAYLTEKERALAGIGDVDPYQNLYTRIANDLVQARARLRLAEVLAIRDLTRMRFAAEMAPEAFADYVSSDGERWRLERLPAEGDAMMLRIAAIRERDHFLVDTINEHYAGFYQSMERPYDEWRMYSFDEQLALEEIARSKRNSLIGGLVAVVAGIVASGSDNRTIREVGEAATVVGGLVVYQGLEKGKEAEIHKAALQELAASLGAELEPTLVEVEGQTLRLTGTAETQFVEWRRLLRELLAAETGLPLDPNAEVASGEAPRRP